MRSLRWRKVARDAWLHKSRTSLVVLAICVGSVGAGSVLDTWSLLRRATRDEYRASNPASATLHTDSVDSALLARVRALPSVARAEARRTVFGSVRTEDGWQTAALFAADDFASKQIGVLKREQGTWPPEDGTIVVEASSVQLTGPVIGGSLRIQVGDAPPADLGVPGIARDVGLAPGWMEHVVYGFVTPKTLARLGAPTSLNELQIVVRDRGMNRDAIRRVAYEVKSLVESTGRRVSDVDVPVPGRHIHAGQIDSLLFTQGAFGLLALLSSALLVVNLISAMLTGQVREIGVMKAIGARTEQIAAMYLVFALFLGLAAAAIALPLAAVIGHAYAQFTADILNFDISGASIPGWVLALQLAVGAVLPVVAAAIPVWRGCRISVAEALRDVGMGGRTDRVGGMVTRLTPGAGRPLLLSLRNAFRKRQRMLLTLATLAGGGAVYLGAINLRASIVGSVDLLFETQRFDMSIRTTKPHDPDSLVAAATRVQGVGRAEAWSGARAARALGDGTLGNSFPITAAPANTQLLRFSVLREGGRGRLATDRNELLVSGRLADDDSSLVPGRAVTLVIGGRRTEWTVVGVAETGPAPAAYASREALSRLVGHGASSVVVASAARGAAAQFDLLQRLRGELSSAGLDVQSGQLVSKQRKVVEDHLLMVAGFLGIMGELMILVGGLGLASTMSLAVLERTREIGVLRAIGARHRAIIMMVQIEGLVIAIASWLVALPLSLPMSIALGKAFGRIMLPVPVTLAPEPSGVLRWLGVVIGVSLLACAWPAYRAMRITTAAALSYE